MLQDALNKVSELLVRLREVVRLRRQYEDEEAKLKDQIRGFLLTSMDVVRDLYKGQGASVPVGDGVISIRQRANVSVRNPDLVKARLSPELWEEVRVVSPQRLWDLMQKDARLTAELLASGAVWVTKTEYVEVRFRKEKEESPTQEQTPDAEALQMPVS